MLFFTFSLCSPTFTWVELKKTFISLSSENGEGIQTLEHGFK